MAEGHTLLLLRHAQAVDYASGVGDHERPLTEFGIEQAAAVGNAIRSRGLRVDRVLCSTAVRTRQTWSALGLDARIEFTGALYNAGADTLLEEVGLLDESVRTALIIGHGPGLPALAARLAGPGSDRRAVDVVNSRYPTATLAEFRVDRPWRDLEEAELAWIRLGHEA
jgi:phosphohistidine phosphatase